MWHLGSAVQKTECKEEGNLSPCSCRMHIEMEGPYSLKWVRIWSDPVSTSKAPLVSCIDRFGRRAANTPQAAELILTYWRHASAGEAAAFKTAWRKRKTGRDEYASFSLISTILSLLACCVMFLSSAVEVRDNATSMSTNNSQRLIRWMRYLEKYACSTSPSRHYLKCAWAQTKIITRRDYIYFPAARYPRDISQ